MLSESHKPGSKSKSALLQGWCIDMIKAMEFFSTTSKLVPIILTACLLYIEARNDTSLSSAHCADILKCESRYDMMNSMKELLSSQNSSQDCTQDIYCTCLESDLRIIFFEMPPYMFTNKLGEVDGIIPCKYKQFSLYAEGIKDMHCRLKSYSKGIGTKKGGGRITKTLQGKGRV